MLLRRLLWTVVCTGVFVVYLNLFFNLPSSADRSYEYVVVWNAVMEEKIQQAKLERNPRPLDEEVILTQDGGTSIILEAIDTTDNNSETEHQQDDGLLLVLWCLSLIGLMYWRMRRVASTPSTSRDRSRTNVRERLRQARLELEQQQAEYRDMVEQLNQQRQLHGQPPLTSAVMDSLQLQQQQQGISGGGNGSTDRDSFLFQLHAPNEQQDGGVSAPDVESLLINNVGATQEEIDRCPVRVLQSGDDLLSPVPSSSQSLPPVTAVELYNNNNSRSTALSHGVDDDDNYGYTQRHQPEQHDNDGLLLAPGATGNLSSRACPICLEPYRMGDQVRTVPCFHSFHTECIDPWLRQQAICPICKYTALG